MDTSIDNSSTDYSNHVQRHDSQPPDELDSTERKKSSDQSNSVIVSQKQINQIQSTPHEEVLSLSPAKTIASEAHSDSNCTRQPKYGSLPPSYELSQVLNTPKPQTVGWTQPERIHLELDHSSVTNPTGTLPDYRRNRSFCGNVLEGCAWCCCNVLLNTCCEVLCYGCLYACTMH